MTSTASARPWFREPWPWILMGLPLTAVIACFATLALAIRSDDGLVSENYYQQGLAINRTLDREKFAASLGLNASFSLSAGHLRVVLGAKEGIVLPDHVRVSFMNPGYAKGDNTLTLTRAGMELSASSTSLGAGTWSVEIEDAAKSWRMSDVITLAENQPVTISAK